MIIINSRKFDGSIHRSWKCKLIEETELHWLFVGTFEDEVKHNKLGIIRRGTISYEYYFKNEWFNIFRFQKPEGEPKFYYCNINMPPVFQKGILDYIDLDIDVLVQNDLTFEILDLDEYEQNREKFSYPSEIQNYVKISLVKLLDIIKKQSFPFNNCSK